MKFRCHSNSQSYHSRAHHNSTAYTSERRTTSLREGVRALGDSRSNSAKVLWCFAMPKVKFYLRREMCRERGLIGFWVMAEIFTKITETKICFFFFFLLISTNKILENVFLFSLFIIIVARVASCKALRLYRKPLNGCRRNSYWRILWLKEMKIFSFFFFLSSFISRQLICHYSFRSMNRLLSFNIKLT